MDFLKAFKIKKTEINNNYIQICELLNTIQKQEFESLSNIAIAIKLSKIHQKIKTYTKTEELEMQLNSSEILIAFLDELIGYDKGYMSNITKETFNRYHNIYVKKNELSTIKELSKTKNKLSKEEHEQEKLKSAALYIDKLNNSMTSLCNKTYLAPFEVACIISNKGFNEMQDKIGAYDICEEWEFLSAIKYVSEKLEKGLFSISKEFLGIPSFQVKTVLYNDGRIIKGFNDYLLDRIAEEYGDLTITLNSTNFTSEKNIDIPPLEITEQNKEDFDYTITSMLEKEREINQANATIAKLEKQLAQAQQVTPASVDSINDDFQKIPRKNGLSYKKTLAKSIAEHIAQTEWKKDKDKKIKTSDMADIVYKKLIDLDFTDELPQEINSLKSWFKNVTPEYAQTGGRPPKES